MEFKDFEDKDKLTKFILQEIKDVLEGGITSRNLTEFRNTYVINADDSLDATYPLYVPFNIISEMVKIVSVKVSFWILPFRAYSTTDAEKAAATSGATGSASGGGSTSGEENRGHQHNLTISNHSDTTYPVHVYSGALIANLGSSQQLSVIGSPSQDHTHSTPAHTHPNHTHSIPAHTHGLTFGIYEEDNSPTIKFYISENAGVSYNDTFFGGYTEDTLNVEITSLLEGSGSKLLKFTSSARARLSVQVEIKLDIQAR